MVWNMIAGGTGLGKEGVERGWGEGDVWGSGWDVMNNLIPKLSPPPLPLPKVLMTFNEML